MRSAQIGEQVTVMLDPEMNNGESLAPGWVVSVAAEPYRFDGYVRQAVNVRVLDNTDGPAVLRAVSLFEERPRPEVLAAMYSLVDVSHGMIAFRRNVDF